VLEGGVVDAGAPAGDRRGVGAGERGDERGGRGRVGDAHVPGEEAVGALVDEPAGDGDPDLDRGDGLGPGHRRAGREVAGAGTHSV